ncbi:hypothetical protein [Aequorivita lipolytica]|uniref:Leucine-rich repeat domain-containing protein n=1 Tax=Aequorivita lipolytica TaxID=153267 RepID=A0A5C6YPV4_9FLAO|nr:hypothetical protein [Aequorivita lipolytica]TXD69105.1 hypothetical protein ESV24_08655 [Aequorivita lipolytica]SRX51322.1 Internalin-J [Aequorivita lipolytica]
MKTSKLLFLLFLAPFLTISCSKDSLPEEENLQEENKYFKYTIGDGPFVHFEDMVLKEIILNNFDINTNKDNEISFEEATAYKGAIDVSFNTIESLTGIEKFVNIIALNCANNKLNTLDMSNNLSLESLNCGNNPFYEIDLSPNTKLTHLDIRTTKIATLDLSKNTNLVVIKGVCNYNLKTVNVRNNSNDKILIFFFGLNNTTLECVQVDDIDYSNTITNWIIPENAIYSLNCFDNIL